MLTITCPGCSKSYRIPSEKLPRGKAVSIPCPNCRTPIRIQAAETPAGARSPVRAKGRPKKPAAGADSAPRSREPLRGDALRRKILHSIRDLPPMPQVISRAHAVMADPNAGIRELTRVIETDQAIASTMVRLANSAYYGLSGRVSTVQKATTMLGQKTLREILTTAGYAELLGKRLDGYGYASGDLWRHSLAVGIGSRGIARTKRFDDPDGAYLAGLLHDAGKLVLNDHVMERQPEFDRYLADESRTFLDAENAVFGFDHAGIAADVCRKWKVPEAIIAAVRYHHRPRLSRSDPLAHVVNLADHIAKSGGLGVGDDDYLHQVEEGVIEFLDLSRSEIQRISATVIETLLKFRD